MSLDSSHPLLMTLELAVPLQILEIRSWSSEERLAFCREHAQIIASQGDILLYGGKEGEAAKLFNILARALACLAYLPGGVDCFGLHWEAEE